MLPEMAETQMWLTEKEKNCKMNELLQKQAAECPCFCYV